MSKVLVLYYSAYGHIEAMANAVAEGARQAVRRSTSSVSPNWYPRRLHANRTTSSIRPRR